MDDKTAPMDNKTVATDDKTAAMFGGLENVCYLCGKKKVYHACKVYQT
jgi:hypothetical protein